jgi:hypothetical protein
VRSDDDDDADVEITAHVTADELAERKWKEAAASGRIIQL